MTRKRFFTYAEKRAAIERELRYRRTYYPRRVAERKMSQEQADEQIAVLEAISADYAQLEPPAPGQKPHWAEGENDGRLL